MSDLGAGPSPRVLRYGDSAVLIEVQDAVTAASLAGWLRRSICADDVVAAARTVLIDGVDPAAVDLSGWIPGPGPPGSTQPVQIEVVYDGADLALVAQAWDCSVEAAVRRHTSIVFTSVFCGFAPGFAYLSGLPTEAEVGRRSTPRTRVPPGSVAIADRWCGVYPTASPGGWRLLGRTDAVLWDPTREQPALLAPGTEVRFVVAGD